MCHRNLISLSVVLLVFCGLRVFADEPPRATETPGEPATFMERSSHYHAAPAYKGFWRKKITWRPRWVKTWQTKRVYVAVWKRMWGPAEVKEWVPVPQPPPGWTPPALEPVIIKQIHHHH